MAVDGIETLDWDWGWGADGEDGASAIGLNGVYFTDAMYRHVSGMFQGDLLDQRTVLIKVLSSRTAYTIYGNPTVIEVGYVYGKSSEILLHEYVHDFLYALHPRFKDAAGEDYGAISDAIPDFLAG